MFILLIRIIEKAFHLHNGIDGIIKNERAIKQFSALIAHYIFKRKKEINHNWVVKGENPI